MLTPDCHSSDRTRHAFMAGTALLALAIVLPAAGQQQIDSRVDTQINNHNPYRGDPGAAFRLRNLVVTGEVAGGRGFRGSVGYTAPNDFRDAIGSDDLFAFRADSSLSSVGFLQLNDTYNQFRYGRDMGLLSYTRGNYDPGLTLGNVGTRPSDLTSRQNDSRVEQAIRNRSGSQTSGGRPQFLDDDDSRLTRDRFGMLAGSDPFRDYGSDPLTVGEFGSGESQVRVTASPLMGLDVLPLGRDFQIRGLNTYDAAAYATRYAQTREVEDIGSAFKVDYRAAMQRDVDDARAASTDVADDPRVVNNASIDNTVRGVDRDQYQAIVAKVAERYERLEQGLADDEAARDAEAAALEADMQLLRDRIAESRRLEAERAAAESAESDDESDPNDPDSEDDRPTAGSNADVNSNLTRPGSVPQVSRFFDVAGNIKRTEITAILGHGERVAHLYGLEESRFNELLRQGERDLRAGKYFDAERIFVRSLRFVPGHPMAVSGLAHARLGAGLSLPAATVLRTLLAENPEMIGATWSAGLVPNRTRLQDATDGLVARLDFGNDSSRHEAGFLYAYIGRLLDNKEQIIRGLRVMRETDEKDLMIDILEAVWLDESAPPAVAND